MTQRLLVLAHLAGALVLVAACNLNDRGFGGVFRRSPSASVDAGRTTPAPLPCDSAVAGAACTTNPEICEVGSHESLQCNRQLRCNGIAWAAQAAPPSCPEACPSDPVEPDPSACAGPDPRRVRCGYEDEGLTCGCVRQRDGDAGVDGGDGGDISEDAGIDESDAGGDGGDAGGGSAGPWVWKCASAEEKCPKTRPHVGAPCVRPITCDYGGCLFEDGDTMHCTFGFWEPASVSCRPDGTRRDGGSEE